jgi:hypothetical protein
MSELVRSIIGKPMTHAKIVPGNTITSLGAEFYKYTERRVAYTSGGTTEIVVGDWIVGATSGAKAEVVGVTLASGTWAGGTAAGVLTVRSQHGTFQSENIKVAAGTNDATIATDTAICTAAQYIHPAWRGKRALAALVNVYANTALMAVNGGKPDQSALVGMPLAAGATWMLQCIEEIEAFKVIDYTASSASIVHVSLYF